jgi:2'-5' RNA ligase
MAASDWELVQVRKDAANKSTTTTDAIADSGKAPPATTTARSFPGERAKVPPVDDRADNTEEITLPRKKDCACVDISKCACAAKATVPEDDPTTADNEGPGVMIALTVPEDVAKSLVQKDGTTPDDMHVTLGYYGRVGKDIDQGAVDTVIKCVAMSAKGYQPMRAHIGGLGRFNASNTSEGQDVLIAHIDSADVHDLRNHLVEQVKKCAAIASDAGSEAPTANGPTPKRDHGFVPHITLKYMKPDDDLPIHKLDRQEFTFTHILMAVGKNRQLFPLGKTEVAKSFWAPIVKADNDQRLATGIVLQPEVVDVQGDVYSAEVIQAAAHNFLAKYNKATQLGLQHTLMKPDGVELVECWVAPVDMVINGRDIIKGTWMMTVRVMDDELWGRIKAGSLGGFSIGGVAKVQRLAQ